jgi:hypothetical protein
VKNPSWVGIHILTVLRPIQSKVVKPVRQPLYKCSNIQNLHDRKDGKVNYSIFNPLLRTLNFLSLRLILVTSIPSSLFRIPSWKKEDEHCEERWDTVQRFNGNIPYTGRCQGQRWNSPWRIKMSRMSKNEMKKYHDTEEEWCVFFAINISIYFKTGRVGRFSQIGQLQHIIALRGKPVPLFISTTP